RDLSPGEPPLGRFLVAPVLAGKEPAREREVREEADPELLARRQNLVLGLPFDERVVVLGRDEAGESRVARDLLSGLDLPGGEVGRADPAHLPVVDELVERA